MKKTSLFFILIFSVFFSYHTAFGAVLYEQSTTGANYLLNGDVSGFPTNHRFYSRFLPPNHIGSLFPGTGGWTATADVRFVRVKLATTNAVACNAIANITLAKTNGNSVAGTVGTGTTSNTMGNCDIPITGSSNSGQAWGSLFFCTNSSCNGTGSNLVMEGSGSNAGYTVDGNQDHEFAGGFGFQLCDSGGCSGGFLPPDQSTRIQDITPADGSTTGSTSVVVSANYYFNDPDITNYPVAPLVLVARLRRTDGIGTPDQHFDFSSLTFGSLTSVSHTFTLPTNTIWELRWDISGDGYYFISPFGTPTTFNVETNPMTGTSGYTTCSITDIAGCLQNALIFLFYPSSASLSQFNGLYHQFINKPPFGYIVAIQSTLAGVNISGTSAFTLQSMPILNTYIFDPIRTAIAWVLWVAFAFVLFHRLKNIAI